MIATMITNLSATVSFGKIGYLLTAGDKLFRSLLEKAYTRHPNNVANSGHFFNLQLTACAREPLKMKRSDAPYKGNSKPRYI